MIRKASVAVTIPFPDVSIVSVDSRSTYTIFVNTFPVLHEMKRIALCIDVTWIRKAPFAAGTCISVAIQNTNVFFETRVKAAQTTTSILPMSVLFTGALAFLGTFL